MTYVVGTLAQAVSDPGVYAGHSKGLTRTPIVDRAAGSVHQELAVCDLTAGGSVEQHVHAFEQALYVLSGELALTVAGRVERLAADEYAFVEVGVPHSLANETGEPARWLELSAPIPGAALEDTAFGRGGAEPEVAFRRDRFDVAALPAPSASIGLAGFGSANVGGAALKMLVDRDFGASQFNLMCVQYAPGGLIKEHDHAFEEAFFFVEGEIEAVLEGETYTLRAGDFCWSSVGSMHALTNRADGPVRWIETQVPQPPGRHQARFRNEWERLLEAG
jgi:quercetin dioxygenase-like cupin family protein